MLKSMTGFGASEIVLKPFGKISVELRSTNHKFLDLVFHLPEGFLSLEDKIKKEVEAQVKRGRVTCVINIVEGGSSNVAINEELLKKYIGALNNIKKQFQIKDEICLDTLIHLPGILSLAENRIPKLSIWPQLNILIDKALNDLIKTRLKEGAALYRYLLERTKASDSYLKAIKTRFKKVIKNKVSLLKSEEEKSSFLKNTDISEELERLSFHIRNFKNKAAKSGVVGKELDFIAQEMQREANTIAAKSCDTAVSAKVVQIKSQIEKIREQVQNIE